MNEPEIIMKLLCGILAVLVTVVFLVLEEL